MYRWCVAVFNSGLWNIPTSVDKVLDGRIVQLHMLAQCIGDVSLLSGGLLNILSLVHQVQEGRVVQTHVKIDALCERRWPPEQHPVKKYGHILHLLCDQGQLGTVCLQQDSDRVCLWPDYYLHHDTAKHSYSSVVKE